MTTGLLRSAAKSARRRGLGRRLKKAAALGALVLALALPASAWGDEPVAVVEPEEGSAAAPRRVSVTVNGVLLGDSDLSLLRRGLKGQVEVLLSGPAPVLIKADEIQADQRSRLHRFLGRVSIARGAETITCDEALWNDQTNTAELSGAVRVVTVDFTALANRAVVNLDLNLAKIYDGRAFFPTQNYYINGALIERLGENKIRIVDGQATTCDGPSPSWTIKAENITISSGGYAMATGVSFNSRYSPILASPFFMFPVKSERQTGFLLPYIGTSSRDGLMLSLPFFWATGENHDLTITPVWREDRGLTTNLEARYHSRWGRGIWQYSFLDDKDALFFSYNNRGGQAEAKNRYWLRGQNDWRLGDWELALDLDLVSDPLYLKEFRDHIDGFYASERLFRGQFGRSFNEVFDPVRTSFLYAQKASYDHFLRASVQYNDNLYSYKNYDTLQRLPSIYYSLVSRPLGEELSLFERLAKVPRLNLDLHYDYFYRKDYDGSSTSETGHRLLFKPSLSWNSPLGNLATLEISGDLEMALYAPRGYRPLRGSAWDKLHNRHDSEENRLTGSLEASLSTTFSRVYDGGPGEAVATRHQLIPTISFNYVSADEDQWHLPYWDDRDRRLPRRTVRYGLLNTFVSKTKSLDVQGLEQNNYFQFLKLGLWGSYELEDNKNWALNRRDGRYYSADYYGKGSGPLEIELQAFFNPYVSTRLLSAFNTRSGEFINHDLSLSLSDKRGDRLTLTYEFDSPGESMALDDGDYQKYDELRASLSVILNSEWSLGFYTRYDLQDQESLETHARLMYQAQCYGLGLIFSHDTVNDDKSVGLVIDLLGLGTFNSSSMETNEY